jgi:GTPase SAR1 family protein
MFYFDKSKFIGSKKLSKIALLDGINQRVPAFKVCLIGNDNVGKHEFVALYLKELFKPATDMVIGCEFAVNDLIISNLNLKLQWWIISTGSQYNLMNKYLKGSSVILIMFDVTDLETIINLRDITKQIREVVKVPSIILVGNKIDMKKQRKITFKQGIRIARENGFTTYCEISIKKGKNLTKLFEIILVLVLSRYIIDKPAEEKEEFMNSLGKKVKNKISKLKKKSNLNL